MSEVKQIYSIVNGAVADVLGSNNLTARTTTDFVDLGRSLSDVAGGYDAFFGALACRITKTVEFVIDKSALSFYDEKTQAWVAEEGEFEALVCAASDDVRTSVSFRL